MARMPGAIWKPLAADWASQPRMRAYDFFCIHTMVGSLVGTDGYFKVGNGAGYGGTESHFGVGPDGTIFQWQDTDFQADANGNGNWHVISSENADTGAPFPAWSGSDVPALTPQQVEANARIAAWLWQTHRIPLDIAGSSRPGARGLAVHRYGVPGYMPVGAEQWSTSQGKACPGDRRIAQIPAISARAKQISGGATAPAPMEDEDDMPKHLRAPNGTIFLFTGDEIVTTGDPAQVDRWADLFGPWRNISQAQWNDLVALTERNRPDGKSPKQFLQDLARRIESLSTPDVDEDAIAAKLSAALAGKTGGVTAAEVKAAVRAVLTEGTNAA